MGKYIKFNTIFLIIVTIISTSGCSTILNSLTSEVVPDEELVICEGRSGDSYAYSEKVKVIIDSSGDVLQLKFDAEDTYSYTILSGYFERFAWHDYKIFILMDEKYYVFDINDYQFPEDDEEPEYELKEYSESEFIDMYPQYKTFKWIKHFVNP